MPDVDRDAVTLRFEILWSRLPVLLGRVLAARGFVTLRIDQNGIGDTPRRPGSHQAGVDADTQAVLAWCAWLLLGA